jgi:hypothetical protein
MRRHRLQPRLFGGENGELLVQSRDALLHARGVVDEKRQGRPLQPANIDSAREREEWLSHGLGLLGGPRRRIADDGHADDSKWS